MDENKKLNILKDRKLDRQEKNKSEGLILLISMVRIMRLHIVELLVVLVVHY